MTLEDVAAALAAAGLEGMSAGRLRVTGKIERWQPAGARGRTAWYVLHWVALPDGGQGLVGRAGDWRFAELSIGVKPSARGMDAATQARLREASARAARQAKAEQRARAERAAARAAAAWARCAPVTGPVAYLAAKGVDAFGVRVSPRGALVIPARAGDGALVGLQVIYPAAQRSLGGGNKRFWPAGMAKRGAAHLIGATPAAGEWLALVEGYATGASVHQATGWPVLVCFDAGGLTTLAPTLAQRFPGARFIVCGDDDAATPGNPGARAARAAAQACGGVAVLPQWPGVRREGSSDFNDLARAAGLAEVAAQLRAAAQSARAADGEDWAARLQRTHTGQVRATLGNVVAILTHHPAWVGVVGYSEHDYRCYLRRPPPWTEARRRAYPAEWVDADTARLRVWLSEHYLLAVGVGDADDAVSVVGHAHPFHPVAEYLQALRWDGAERLAHWLTWGLGAEDSAYVRAVAAKWAVSAVARVLAPPCKADGVLILEGAQGVGKSTALKVMGGAWYSDTPFDLGSTDGYQALHGAWIVEISELDAMNKAEATKSKAFFSSQVDRYRPSYGRRVEAYPRQCVFAGTTNQDSYLKDYTGNRRYWPVRCTAADLQWLADARNQLWAEAVAAFRDGARWWVEGAEELAVFESTVDQRVLEDPWQEAVTAWLDDVMRRAQRQFTSREILTDALGLANHQQRMPEQSRVGVIMHRLGFHKRRVRRSGQLVYVYERSPDT